MKIKILFSLLISSVLWSTSTAQDIPLDSLDSFIPKMMKDFEVTGLAIGIVQDDSVIYSKGFGLTETGKAQKVNEETLFGIGSISKSFTALTLGILVDEGKVDWDDRVVDYLPYFELYDPYVTENFTIRDLLTHRSGLKEVSGGTLWYHTNYSRVEIIKRLKHLKPVSGFREKTAYQNTMFVVAGEIVREVTGVSWDEFLEKRVLKPLQMNNSTSISSEREANPNVARPHIWDGNFDKTAIIQERGDNLAAAGFIYSSAQEMSQYMRLLLKDGVIGNDTIVSGDAISEIFRPQVPFQIMGPPFQNEFSSYGLGWWVTPMDGHKLIEHSGGIDGMSAQLFMVKDLNIGVVILTNVSKEPASLALKAKLLQLILDNDDFDLYDLIVDFRERRIKRVKESRDSKTKIANTQPSRPSKDYTGTYEDRMYGDITISQESDGSLRLVFSHTPLFRATLTHWHYDTFKVDWHDIRVPDGYLTFTFDSDQKTTGFEMEQADLLDVDFSELEIMKKKD